MTCAFYDVKGEEVQSSPSLRRLMRMHGSNRWGKAMKTVPLSEVKDDLSKFLRLAETEQIVITPAWSACW